jgi:putative chitinase
MVITSQQLIAITGNKIDTSVLEKIINSLNLTFEKYEINTPFRVCHFLSQVLHESGCFRYNREIWGPTETQKQYEGRISLGNNQPGDGFKFRGRGWIQLTGRANYEKASKDLNIDLVNNPDLAASYPYVSIIAGWYWCLRGLNTIADKDDVTAITKKVNGGLNGIEERTQWLSKCKSVIL